MMQFLIAFDQLINTLVWAKHEGFGFADESLSARAFRLSSSGHWKSARRAIDALFFWQQDHCRNAYLAECERRQYPPHYCD